MKHSFLYKTGLILALIALAWLIISYRVLENIRVMMESRVPFEKIDGSALMIHLGLAYLLIFHLFSIISLVIQIKYLNGNHLARYILLSIGSISTIFFLGDAALLSDIGKEYPIWDVSGEFIALYGIHALHGSFILGMILASVDSIRLMKKSGIQMISKRDDAVFITVNMVGLICGLAGMTAMCMEFFANRPIEFTRYLVLWHILFILIPYGVLVFIWLIIKFTETPVSFYDEKQFSDASSASFITLFLTVIFIIGGFLIGYAVAVETFFLLWIPLTLFFILGMFSGLTLYYFKFN